MGRPTALTDQEGVNFVGLSVARHLRWLFRPQDVADQGIDAHVEVAKDGRATGRLLALQIKSGPSQFGRKVDDGWTFYYSDRERSLWNGHVLPVMVVLVDIDNDIAYWQRISPLTERRTKKRYAVHVPRSQTLSTAHDAWELAASGLEQVAHERWRAHLEVLPPQVASVLTGRTTDRSQCELIALHLAEGRLDAAGTTRRLLEERPLWMESDDGWPWAAVGAYSARHEAMLESSSAYEYAAKHGGPAAGTFLGAAALHAVIDPAHARTLIGRAEGHPGAQVSVAIAQAILEHPQGVVGPMRIDGVMEAAGSTAHDDVTVQKFLAAQAVHGRDDFSASRHAERAFELAPQDTDVMVQLAGILLRRSATPDAQPDDTSRAIALLRDAVAQLRRWSGPSADALDLLGRALLVTSQYEEALHWLLPEPHGTSTVDEFRTPSVLRLALHAAHSAASELTNWVLEQMGDTHADTVAKVRVGVLELPEADLIALWSAELDRAEADEDFEPLSNAVFRLARLGVDKSRRLLPLIERGVLPAGADRLPAAVARLRDDRSTAMDQLRVLAATEVTADHYLISVLQGDGRVPEAVEACEAAFDRFREPAFKALRAVLLARSADQRAPDALREALRYSVSPDDHLMLASMLAQLRAEDDDLAEAELLLTEAVSRFDSPPPGAAWDVVRVQLARSADHRAAVTVARYRPAVRSTEEAALWFRAMRTVPWDGSLASEAIALADQFKHEPELATALLGHVVWSTRGVGDPGGADGVADPDEDGDDFPDRPVDDRPPVAGDLHRRAFEALDRLIETYGDRTGARVIRGESPEESVEQLINILRESANPHLGELFDMVARGRVPTGMLALPTSRTYSEVLVHRAGGQLVSIPLDDAEHDLDVAAARAALRQRVTVDLSSLFVLASLLQVDGLVGRYGQLQIPTEAQDDLTRAAVSIQGLAASPGSVGWDSVAERPWIRDHTDSEYRLVRERAAMMANLGRLASVRTQRSAVFPKELGAQISKTPWVAAIELAAHAGTALWCDDLAVRRLARNVNVPTFSTMAVIEVITEDALDAPDITPGQIEEIVAMRGDVAARLLAERVVDLPVTTQQVIDQARADGWDAGGAAALALSRPGWWHGRSDPIRELLKLYAAVGEHRPDTLASWQFAAMLGAARALPAQAATATLSALALLGWDGDITVEPSLDVMLAGCRNARRAASTLEGIPDPLLAVPASVATLRAMGFERSEATIQELLAASGTDSSPE